jgi:hypothetical protein
MAYILGLLNFFFHDENEDRNCDAPPNSLMDITTSINLKIAKGKGVGSCSLVRSTLGVEGRARAPGWD